MHTHPIAITGMHRTGTSMVTRALHDSGLRLLGSDADELVAPADDNPEGFWENKAIVACNDELLEATGGAWDNPPSFGPQGVDDQRVSHVGEAATAALAKLREHEHWGFKDPRTCLTAAFWCDLEPDLHFIVCVRHPLEVALSLKRRNQNSYSLGLALWERYYDMLLAAVPADRRIVTHYDTFFLDPVGELRRLCEFAGLEASDISVRPDLRHYQVGVTLSEADVSARTRELYSNLCHEAGVAPLPEPQSDEGRVRRLVLDGAVAQRNADLRQQEIERLEERETEMKIANADLVREQELARSRIRDLETELQEIDAEHKSLERLSDALVRAEARLAKIEERGRRRAVHLELAIDGERLGRSLAFRSRGLIRRFRGGLKPLLRGLLARAKRALMPRATAAARRLPEPAQDALRRGRRAALEPDRTLVPKAKAAARHLPAPAQQALRSARTRLSLRPISSRSASTEYAVEPSPAPRGPGGKLWKDNYDRLVATTVGEADPWLVATPGSPRSVRRVGGRRASLFPEKGKPLINDVAHVAHLEALRFRGFTKLVVPEGSRPWLTNQVVLRDHLAGHYARLADEHMAGIVYDLGRAANGETRSLRAIVEQLARAQPDAPSVLAWTDVDISTELAGFTSFGPPAGEQLPYLDSSVDAVVVDELHDVREAERVASLCVITVDSGSSDGVRVRSASMFDEVEAAPTIRTLVWTDDTGDERWRASITDRANEAGADVLFAPVEATGVDQLGSHDVVIALEPMVLPLPGSIETAAALSAAYPTTAIAAKVLRGDGRLEAAGGIVFFDRSVGLVANGSNDVSGPWHEYSRPVCWAPGLVAASRSLWQEVPVPAGVSGRVFVLEWCSELWAHGRGVEYHPTVTAVRAVGNGGEPSMPLATSRWQRVLDLRPPRPRDLSDGAWRYLLARDDVGACRG